MAAAPMTIGGAAFLFGTGRCTLARRTARELRAGTKNEALAWGREEEGQRLEKAS